MPKTGIYITNVSSKATHTNTQINNLIKLFHEDMFTNKDHWGPQSSTHPAFVVKNQFSYDILLGGDLFLEINLSVFFWEI